MSRYPYAQVQLICFATGFGLIIFHAINPIRTRVIYNLEMFNEVCILLCIYHHFCFTDFVKEPEARYLMGRSLINVTLFNLGANMLYMTQSVVRDILFKAKKLRYQLRNKRVILMRKLLSPKKAELRNEPEESDESEKVYIPKINGKIYTEQPSVLMR